VKSLNPKLKRQQNQLKQPEPVDSLNKKHPRLLLRARLLNQQLNQQLRQRQRIQDYDGLLG
jgi:hypothetical protein